MNRFVYTVCRGAGKDTAVHIVSKFDGSISTIVKRILAT